MGNIIVPFMGRVAAILASASIFSFSSHGTHEMIHLSSFFKCFSTMVRYRVICSFFVLYSRWVCPTISWESFLIANLVVVNIRKRSSPASTTLYSASLLEVEKLRRITCSISFPVGDCRTRLTLDPDTLGTLYLHEVSTIAFQGDRSHMFVFEGVQL